MYSALDKCMMSALLRCPSHPCYIDDMGMSTRNKSPSLSVTYKEGTMSVFSVLEQASGSPYGESTVLMRSWHGCCLSPTVRLRSMDLRA